MYLNFVQVKKKTSDSVLCGRTPELYLGGCMFDLRHTKSIDLCYNCQLLMINDINN